MKRQRGNSRALAVDVAALLQERIQRARTASAQKKMLSLRL
jgi:hypothetical protein